MANTAKAAFQEIKGKSVHALFDASLLKGNIFQSNFAVPYFLLTR